MKHKQSFIYDNGIWNTQNKTRSCLFLRVLFMCRKETKKFHYAAEVARRKEEVAIKLMVKKVSMKKSGKRVTLKKLDNWVCEGSAIVIYIWFITGMILDACTQHSPLANSIFTSSIYASVALLLVAILRGKVKRTYCAIVETIGWLFLLGAISIMTLLMYGLSNTPRIIMELMLSWYRFQRKPTIA